MQYIAAISLGAVHMRGKMTPIINIRTGIVEIQAGSSGRGQSYNRTCAPGAVKDIILQSILGSR